MVKVKAKARKPNKMVKTAVKQKKQSREISQYEVADFIDEESEIDDDLDQEMDNISVTDGSDNEENAIGDDNISDEDEAETHKESLAKLAKTDPEFYQFLQENDKKLLQFNLSDEEAEENEDDDEQTHKPSGTLEVASDESDFEDDEEIQSTGKLTLKQLKLWQSEIQSDKSNKTIVNLCQAFHAALIRIESNDIETETDASTFIVEGSGVFNAVIQLCVLELGPAIRRYLGVGAKQAPHKCKKFTKIKRYLKLYLNDLLKLLTTVTSSNIQTVLLKHLHYMSSLIVSYPHLTKSIVKRLINLWGTADESVRVIAFFCILRITNNQKVSLLDTVLKAMYLTYVRNSKFVSLNTLAGINFMRRSLVEMFALDLNTAYQHVFLYIRQLAIHLRNAITLNRKENVQAVYNWQFINSLRLWANLLSVAQLPQLIYPLVQVCLGTLKLVPTQQYFPLRFHVVQILMDLSKSTGTFIPVMPFLLQVLTTFDFNKKHVKVSMKPMHFTCLLRLSKSQLQENGFKDAVIEMVYGLLLEYLAAQSHTIAFPDLALLATVHIKDFLKKSRNVNYNRKFKQILEKIEQNSQFIESEREKLTLNITDFKKIEGWEAQIRSKGTPIATFYANWDKVRNVKKNKQLTNNEALGDYKLPTLKKLNKNTKMVSKDGPVELFPSDSEEEEGVVEEKPKRGKRGGKNVAKKVAIDESGPVEDNGEKDMVHDFEMGDW